MTSRGRPRHRPRPGDHLRWASPPRRLSPTMRRSSWMNAVRLVLAALAFSGVWLWVGDGEDARAGGDRRRGDGALGAELGRAVGQIARPSLDRGVIPRTGCTVPRTGYSRTHAVRGGDRDPMVMGGTDRRPGGGRADAELRGAGRAAPSPSPTPAGRSHESVKLDLVLAEHLATNLIALDVPTAVAKSKLLRVLQLRGAGPRCPAPSRPRKLRRTPAGHPTGDHSARALSFRPCCRSAVDAARRAHRGPARRPRCPRAGSQASQLIARDAKDVTLRVEREGPGARRLSRARASGGRCSRGARSTRSTRRSDRRRSPSSSTTRAAGARIARRSSAGSRNVCRPVRGAAARRGS